MNHEGVLAGVFSSRYTPGGAKLRLRRQGADMHPAIAPARPNR
jgi:hypothetical protein